LFTATVPLDGSGVGLSSDAAAGGTDVLSLLDARSLAGSDLPCQVEDSDLWFADVPADLERAKQFCAECPVRTACLAGALARHEPWGVWGGEIFERGAVIPRKRPRGRPRKQDLERDRELARAAGTGVVGKSGISTTGVTTTEGTTKETAA
jgi:WhiB family redox-sensing transcriptional regulator